MKKFIQLFIIGLASSVSPANAAFVTYFEDSFAGGSVTGGGSGLTTTATLSNPDVSNYITATDSIGWAGGIGNPQPALNLFSGTDTGAEAASFYLNLTTVASATYSVGLQTTLWGSTATPYDYSMTVSSYNGADTTSGTALGTDGVVNGGFNSPQNLEFTFVAQSAATTLFFDATILQSLNHDVYVDNIDIKEDLSTVPEPGIVGLTSIAGLLLMLRRRRY